LLSYAFGVRFEKREREISVTPKKRACAVASTYLIGAAENSDSGRVFVLIC